MCHAITPAFDADSRPQASVNPLGYATTNIYDVAGQPIAVQNARGYVAMTVYDPDGRVQATINSLGARTTLTYDAASQRIGVQDALGYRATTVYGPAGRPQAPSFAALDKNTGKVIWTDSSPGVNVLHGQWSSPAYAVIDKTPQTLFGGGDGWLYAFEGTAANIEGHPKHLWMFDCNPKESKYVLGGRADRNHIIGTPVFYKGLAYVGVGEDPEHGEGVGHLWCIDPRKRGDVSSELAFSLKDLEHPLPHRRNQAVIKEQGEVARPNPNSAAIWHYAHFDRDQNGKIDFEETMHRTCGTVSIKDDLLFVADFSGLVHCLNALTGEVYWTHDMLAACWGSPLIVEDKVYLGDEDGDIVVFKLSKELEQVGEEHNMGSSIYSTPVVANNTLFIADKDHVFAITPDGK